MVLLQLFIINTRDDTQLTKRQMLNRRRMEEAFFQYAALKVSQWYPNAIDYTSVKLHSGTSETLEMITTVYHGAFMNKYAGMFQNYECIQCKCKSNDI